MARGSRAVARPLVGLEPARRVLSELIIEQAAALGDRPFVTAAAEVRTFASMQDAAARLAGALAATGVRRGDRVGVIAENRLETLDIFAACSWLGAILVPVNTAARGPQLEHVLANAGTRLLAVEPALLSHLDSIERLPDELERIWLLDADVPSPWRGVPVEPFPRSGDPVDPVRTWPGESLAILYTSGTTGPSKGACCPQAQFYWWGVNTASMLGVTGKDVLYTCLPLFHTNALNTFVQALVHGARYVLGPRFSASQFWPRLAEAEATVTYLLGAMVSILVKHDPGPHDRAHRVRIALAPATPPDLHEAFLDRFGVRVVDGHGMTETNVVIGPRDGEQRPGLMGRVMPGFLARVVDEEDAEVPDGAPGELVMRANEPFAFSTGYWRMPEQTIAAWRNLWFHSGDRVVRDADGYFRFLDRMKDAIRRRGENISAWEVEQVLQGHSDVAAAAVFPVPSELGEDEVMAAVVPRPGASIDPLELIVYCEPRLAYFAIPRYVEVMDIMPLTENGKVRKYVLRERGVTESTWDLETTGYVLRRSRRP